MVNQYMVLRNIGKKWVIYMRNKGQVTIFMIVGIILLAMIILAVLLNLSFREDEVPTAKEDTSTLQGFVQSCLQEVGTDAVVLSGMQGGYTTLPESYLITDYSEIGYSYYKGKDRLLSKDEFEYQISKFVEDSIDECLDNFNSFRKQGYAVESGNPEVETFIREGNVMVELNYPISLSRSADSMTQEDFSSIIDVRLGHIYDIVREINNMMMDNPEWVDMILLSEFDVKVDLIPYDEDEAVYVITDNLSYSGEGKYEFMFASSYMINENPILDLPEVLEFKDEEPIVYQIKAIDPENDVLKFSSNTALFDITESGVIMFQPEVPGEYDVIITVEDSSLNRVSQKVKFIIKE